jgi:hypothetical protein
MCRIGEVILFFFQGVNEANSQAIKRVYNAEKGQKNKPKCIAYFFTTP